LELIKQLGPLLPQLKILVFTMRAESIYAERALRAGAHGYITKEEGTEKAIEAMRLLLQGRVYVSPQLAQTMVAHLAGQPNALSPTERLSDRELEILELIGTGLSTRDIAGKLSLSIKTIESHREHIKTKLKLKSAPELTNYAYKWVNGK
ncbi:MAG TPA: response regulator transcription factor, partial [Clostridia bacterium]|nr:response regulator transcription factor [Clostridia bacterium]